MAKNPNRKAKPVKRDDPMTGAMKFFLAGCFAELYLLVVRRFYVYGAAEQVIAWDSYLNVFALIGVAVLVLGAVLSVKWKADKKKRTIGWFITGIGVFLSVSSFLIHWNMSVLSLLTIIVPVIMLLGILWTLYDRECALALTILAGSLIAVWVCRQVGASIYYGTLVKGIIVVYILLLAAIFVLVKGKKLAKLIPAKADPVPVYVACALSILALIVALLSSTFAYYAMWVLAAIIFGLAVYYTVKQL